ncbi:tRNA glutamyl-Q(34) synthetase GluQRS [Uliginosibacterium sp. H1]|uniref:tRNA glutamyl-Q(34) synthetase GluQRS n=1 Tax=Uliginosibacterium sp. H1 TaxID=3114757 RepID=UPI002E19FB31|nr:tRNA glutamyl-Q(34) synthetase GluQRS [Uliginosibacterium sp. H1]
MTNPASDHSVSCRDYVGRFAPSPTGPLHFGSLVAALGSCLDARHAGGRWLLRMEDVDAPRCVPGAADTILLQLEALGFEWDGELLWQSRRERHYHAALTRLRDKSAVYPCACTRREMADSALARDGSRRYPGTCRSGLPAGREARAWRLRTQPGVLRFVDLLQGEVSEDLERDVGDFVLLRADGLFAYQLAVVVDDAEQGVTHVVRGADLLDSTLRQIYLQQQLDYPTPQYLHLPVATNMQGEKLSKQTLARALDVTAPARTLAGALRFLGQPLPADWADASLAELWRWAIAHWDRARIPRMRAVAWPEG